MELADIKFVETDAQTINTSLINGFEEALGDTLYPSDERRIFLNQQTQVIVALKNDINNSGKENLLRYATKEKLDALGEFQGATRLPAQKAKTVCRITLSSPRNTSTIITKGKKVTPDGVLFFVLSNDVTIPANISSALAEFEAAETGEIYNEFAPGQIKNIVDPIPYVSSIVNIEESIGGADIEDDDRFRERIRLAPKSFSVAGPEGAYEYWAKTADVNITDVYVDSPSPGTVKIITLLKNGEIPNQEVLDKVLTVCSARDVRPLTDKVEVGTPTIIEYNIDLTYYLDKQLQTEESKFRKNIEGQSLDFMDGAIKEFINWQQEKLGRAINPDELRYRIQNAASYTDIYGNSYTAVRRVVLNSPVHIDVLSDEVAKVGLITVNYGGLE